MYSVRSLFDFRLNVSCHILFLRYELPRSEYQLRIFETKRTLHQI